MCARNVHGNGKDRDPIHREWEYDIWERECSVLYINCLCVVSVQSNVCKHVDESRHGHLFASAQCLGYALEFGQLTDELCLPSKSVIVGQVQRAVQRLGAVAVFVATDRDAMIDDFRAALKPTVRSYRSFYHF